MWLPKTGVMAAEISALHHRNKLHFKINKNKIWIVILFHNITVFTAFLIKLTALISIRDLFQKFLFLYRQCCSSLGFGTEPLNTYSSLHGPAFYFSLNMYSQITLYVMCVLWIGHYAAHRCYSVCITRTWLYSHDSSQALIVNPGDAIVFQRWCHCWRQ